jgi:hypothetical protein
MEQYELLQFVAGNIEEMGLRYFVTGSTATIFYAEPRLTNDIELLLICRCAMSASFAADFPSGVSM